MLESQCACPQIILKYSPWTLPRHRIERVAHYPEESPLLIHFHAQGLSKTILSRSFEIFHGSVGIDANNFFLVQAADVKLLIYWVVGNSLRPEIFFMNHKLGSAAHNGRIFLAH